MRRRYKIFVLSISFFNVFYSTFSNQTAVSECLVQELAFHEEERIRNKQVCASVLLRCCIHASFKNSSKQLLEITDMMFLFEP